LLSIGAFIENLTQAAGVYGYKAHVEILTENAFEPDVAKIRLDKTAPVRMALEKLSMRRTVKSNLLAKELKSADVAALSRLTDNRLYYFPRGSEHADLMSNEAIENFKIQAHNKKAMEELAFWTRLKDADVKRYRDGVTVDGMEITGIAGWYVRSFMDKQDVLGETFRDKGIEKTADQAQEGAGWLVITSEGTSVKDLVETGRRFQRMALEARERMIAIHPMTQSLEEKNGQKNIRENHKPGMIPQFMLRVGYLGKYPDPVSLRRPVEWFVKS